MCFVCFPAGRSLTTVFVCLTCLRVINFFVGNSLLHFASYRGWFLKSRQAYQQQQQQQKIPTKLFVLPSGVKKLNGAKGDKFLLVSLLLLLLQYGLLFFGCFCLVIENYKGTYLRVYVCDYKANNIVATDIILPVFR